MLNKTNHIFNSILGQAGTGKSYWLKRQLKNDSNFALITSSTGISALNIQGRTIHSVLNYYDTHSLLQKYKSGKLQQKLLDISKKYKNLCIDEAAMLPGEQLQLICMAFVQLKNQNSNFDFRLIILGDAAQLPTINSKFFFQVKAWNFFYKQALTEVKRQKNLEFINFLKAVRLGEIEKKLDWFENKITYNSIIDANYEGTTILSTNKAVNKFNFNALNKIKTLPIEYEKITIGKSKPEWKLIPDKIYLKPKCKVILTQNNHKEGYCNGDLATVIRCYNNLVEIRIDRTQKHHLISYISQKNIPLLKSNSIGSVTYLPLKLAYALTVHRVQGLTLDYIQTSVNDNFLKNLSGGLYVILSRLRDYNNLRLIGNTKSLIQSNYIDPQIKKFIIDYETKYLN